MTATIPAKRIESNRARFNDLCQAPLDEQLQLFLKSFIFALGSSWKDTVKLAEDFRRAVQSFPHSTDEGETLNVVQAADFLQKHGLTRTAQQRSAEIKDIDMNADNRIALVEYLLLHYKAMVLKEFYKRMECDPVEDLGDGAIGVTNVGDKLLDELFTVPVGLDPATEEAIEEFMKMKKQRQAKMDQLSEVAAQGGVKGLAAKNELEQMGNEDTTEMNRVELTLNAAKRKAAKCSGEVALAAKKKEEEELEKKKLQSSRDRLAARRAQFEQQAN